jgi:uncharacterized protein (TIGR02466 family)
MKVHSLFSTPVYERETNIDTKHLLSIAKKETYTKAGYPKGVSNPASLSVNLKILNKKLLKNIKKEIIKYIYDYTSNVLQYSNSFNITTSWFTQTLTNQTSDYHKHKNSVFSAVLHLNNANGNLGFIDFEDNLFDFNKKENNIFNSNAFEIVPKEGSIIIFPSNLYHKIMLNNENETRYSLALNIMPTGKIGSKTSDSYYEF